LLVALATSLGAAALELPDFWARDLDFSSWRPGFLVRTAALLAAFLPTLPAELVERATVFAFFF
jgi:hypothetical protein